MSLLEAQECCPFALAGEGAARLAGLLQAVLSQLARPRGAPDDGAEVVALRSYLDAETTSFGFATESQGCASVLKQ